VTALCLSNALFLIADMIIKYMRQIVFI
jgi:hypothetical protein